MVRAIEERFRRYAKTQLFSGVDELGTGKPDKNEPAIKLDHGVRDGVSQFGIARGEVLQGAVWFHVRQCNSFQLGDRP